MQQHNTEIIFVRASVNIKSQFLIWLFASVMFFSCSNTEISEVNSLKDVYKNHFLVGAALNTDQILEKDSVAEKIIKRHYNTITAENAFKWERIHPKPNTYNFELADKFIAYGEKNNMVNIGHVLIWHSQTPEWVYQDSLGKPLSKDALLERIKDHIYAVVGRYKGKIKGWDVVNEALEEDGSLRQSDWMKIIGEDYILKAFEFARQADPDAELYYNDFSIENELKRHGAVKLLKDLKSKGAKVDGVGLQGHYKMDWPAPEQVDSTIKAFAALGLKVLITELDIDVLPYDFGKYTADINYRLKDREELNPFKNGLPDSMQRALADRYSSLFKVFLNNSASVSRVTFWGVTDKESWLNYWPIMGRTNYPLLFDRDGKPKKAYDEVVRAVKRQS